ncbi:uncharacterized protein [Choristoneura fumiferana]|uniref:uncharacterized protein n=1 Tax=Choristoneura fumiferana TaxID=7141 RepID=UPI003D15E41D
MDNLKKGTILLAILLTMSSVNGSCFLESLGTYPCTGRVVCLEDLELAVSLVRDWQCRRHESYDYQYSSYRRVRIDEDYDISIYASEIDTATKFNPYSAVNILTDHIIQMSLVNSNETTVPAAISSLRRATSIDLSQNAIESISLGAFSRTNLKQLNVSHNIIATLEVGDGPVGVSQITSIDLSHNAIKSIPNNYFRQCPELLHLNLSHNSIESVDILTFEGITQLETLYISNNKISQLGLYFARFVHLKELFLDNNNLSAIEEKNFNMMTTLDTLNISSNRLVSIDSSSFNLLVKLRNLNLSNNKIETIPKVLLEKNVLLSLLDLSYNSISELEPGTFEGKTITQFNIQNNKLSGTLKKNTFQGIYVEELDLSVANITELGPNLFDGLNSTVQLINISSNSISKIHKTSFSKLEVLTTLDLSHNKIQDIEFDMTDLKNLSYLYINDNSIQNITQTIFKGLVSLKEIDLSNNDIKQIEALSFEDLNDVETFSLNKNPLPHIIAPQMFSGLSSCTELHLTYTNINSLQNNAFSGMDSLRLFNVSNGDLKTLEFNTFNGTGSVEILVLSFNKIELFLINNTQINSVTEIYLNNNRLRFITKETFKDLANLHMLNLEQNLIVKIKDEAFVTLKTIRTLIISANENMVFNSSIFSNTPTRNLILNNDTAKFAFGNVENTSIAGLDVSFCDITDINSVQLSKIESLERLKLSWNKIRNIDKTTFQKLRYLSWVDLSHNKISYIQPGSFSDSKTLSILKLNNNYLTSLQFGVLDGLVDLQILYLSSNILNNLKANIFHNTLRLQKVYLDDNIIDDIDFSEFAAANIKEISIGGNLISCDTLTNLKKKERTGLIVTAKNENYHAENVDGITCRSMIKFDNVSSVNSNATVLTATLLSTIEQFRATVERLLNRNETKEQNKKNDFTDVSISIEHFVDAFNKSEAANSVFLSKLMEINNGTNWYLGNIEKFLKEHNNDSAGDKSYIGTELKDKDIEKILSGMLVEQRESLRTEFKGMLDDLKSNNVGNNQMASQTTDVSSSSDLKSALYFIATCLAALLCVMLLTLIFIYFRSKNKLSNSTSLYSSRQPISNVMEME